MSPDVGILRHVLPKMRTVSRPQIGQSDANHKLETAMYQEPPISEEAYAADIDTEKEFEVHL